MDENVHKEKLARINYKQVILVAIITAVTSITVTLISSGVFFKDETPTPRPITFDCDSYKEENKVLKIRVSICYSDWLITGYVQSVLSQRGKPGRDEGQHQSFIGILQPTIKTPISLYLQIVFGSKDNVE